MIADVFVRQAASKYEGKTVDGEKERRERRTGSPTASVPSNVTLAIELVGDWIDSGKWLVAGSSRE
jgi:hypothetical protein